MVNLITIAMLWYRRWAIFRRGWLHAGFLAVLWASFA
jgi:hypothetical protein